MREVWGKYWQIARWEKIRFWQSVWLLPLFGVGLRVVGYQRLRGWLEKRPLGEIRDEKGVAKKLSYLVAVASVWGIYPEEDICLVRSLLLWWLLRREGLEGEVVLGVRKEEAALKAHAWVELEGVVLNDRADVRAKHQVLG